jgi:hypothetical protein
MRQKVRDKREQKRVGDTEYCGEIKLQHPWYFYRSGGEMLKIEPNKVAGKKKEAVRVIFYTDDDTHSCYSAADCYLSPCIHRHSTNCQLTYELLHSSFYFGPPSAYRAVITVHTRSHQVAAITEIAGFPNSNNTSN